MSPLDLPWKQNLVAKTDVLRQDHREDWCIMPAISTISVLPSLSSIGWRRRTTSLSTRIRSLRVRNSWEDEQTSSKIHPIYRWRNQIASYSNSQPPPKSPFVSWNLQHVKIARYDLPLPHDFIHHDARISIINLSTLFTHFNFQKRSRYEKTSQLLSFKAQRTPRLLKPEERSVRSSPLWNSEKEEAKGHL